jgi:hypothetical protein
MEPTVNEFDDREPGDIDPSFSCVLSTRSLDEVKRAASLLRNHGYPVEVGAAPAHDVIATADMPDYSYGLWVPGDQAEFAANFLASFGFASELDAKDLVPPQRPWVKTYSRCVLRLAAAFLVLWLIWVASTLL